MSNTDLAYIAGVVDSDGCICVQRYASSRTRQAESYGALVNVQQVEREALELAHRTLGGHILTVPRPKRFPNARQMYRWTVKSQLAVAALEQLRPYLRIKAAQADNALALGQLVWTIQKARFIEVVPGRCGPRCRTASEIESMRRHWIVSRHLNSGHILRRTTQGMPL